jgi:uncharacterized protein
MDSEKINKIINNTDLVASEKVKQLKQLVVGTKKCVQKTYDELCVGDAKMHYPNGNPKKMYKLDDNGWRHGSYISYWSNGKKKHSGVYKHGSPIGTHTRYYSNGELKKIYTIEANGDRNGNFTSYYANGAVKHTGLYIQGYRFGSHIWLHINGRKRKIKHYELVHNKSGNNVKYYVKTGMEKRWYSNGKLRMKGKYDNDKRKGKWIWYAKNAKQVKVGFYHKGKKHGNWQTFDEDGHDLMRMQYKNGKKHGLYVKHTKKKSIYGEYRNNKKTGDWEIEYN